MVRVIERRGLELREGTGTEGEGWNGRKGEDGGKVTGIEGNERA